MKKMLILLILTFCLIAICIAVHITVTKLVGTKPTLAEFHMYNLKNRKTWTRLYQLEPNDKIMYGKLILGSLFEVRNWDTDEDQHYKFFLFKYQFKKLERSSFEYTACIAISKQDNNRSFLIVTVPELSRGWIYYEDKDVNDFQEISKFFDEKNTFMLNNYKEALKSTIQSKQYEE